MSPNASPLDGHATAERRSLAFHRRVAAVLQQEPERLELVRSKLRRSIEDALSRSRGYALGWLQLVDGPLSELLEFLCEDSEKARAYRQASPFAGLLSARERWEIWRSTR